MPASRKKLLFVTTLNLATNPRLVKELDLALETGYMATVVCFDFDGWSRHNNERICKRLRDAGCIIYTIPAGRKPFYPWLMSTAIAKICSILSRCGFRSTLFLSFVNKRAWLLKRAIKKISSEFDLLVAHNPGSFYPVYYYARQWDIPFGIDVEDYHPGENTGVRHMNSTAQMMQAILPAAAYISFASPNIMEQTAALFEQPDKPHWLVINNCFSHSDFIFTEEKNKKENEPLKFVWFSQNISHSRGLEQFVPVIGRFAKEASLYLVGNVHQPFYDSFIKGVANVHCLQPMAQEELHKALKDFDIGLAIEPGKDLNNNIALSNKIWAYFQAGLYILASDTPAQKDFISLFPYSGVLSSLRDKELEGTIRKLIQSGKEISQQRKNRYLAAREYSWEKETVRLKSVWEKLY